MIRDHADFNRRRSTRSRSDEPRRHSVHHSMAAGYIDAESPRAKTVEPLGAHYG